MIGKIKDLYQLYKAMKKYGKYYSECRKTLRSMLYYYSQKKHYKIAIWGAGLKGKAFLKITDPSRQFITYVYDINQSKFGTVMPTGHPVVDYKDKQDAKVVLLMNNNFETDTAVLLEEEKMNVILINVDSIIAGGLTAKEIVAFHRETSGDTSR